MVKDYKQSLKAKDTEKAQLQAEISRLQQVSSTIIIYCVAKFNRFIGPSRWVWLVGVARSHPSDRLPSLQTRPLST